MAHTPGPWGIDWDIRPDIVTENRKGGYFDEGHIATMSKYENNPDDARLIAAAPDLLAALEAVEWFGGLGDVCPLCRQRKLKGHADGCQLAAALTKAKGL